jgi:hypothetical protein
MADFVLLIQGFDTKYRKYVFYDITRSVFKTIQVVVISASHKSTS